MLVTQKIIAPSVATNFLTTNLANSTPKGLNNFECFKKQRFGVFKSTRFHVPIQDSGTKNTIDCPQSGLQANGSLDMLVDYNHQSIRTQIPVRVYNLQATIQEKIL